MNGTSNTITSDITVRHNTLALLYATAERAALPSPIVDKIYHRPDGKTELLFRTRDQLAAWAEYFGSDVEDRTVLVAGEPLTDISQALIRFCSSDIVLACSGVHPVKAEAVGA